MPAEFSVVSSGVLNIYPEITDKKVYYVDSNADESGDGSSWANPFKTIDEAFIFAMNGDEIRVKKGDYYLSGTIKIAQGKRLSIYGGFAGDETNIADRNIEENNTTIHCNGLRCLENDGETILDGLIFTEGVSDIYKMGGGAIFNGSGSNTGIYNCIFTENSADRSGGAIHNGSDSTTRIDNCIFMGNIAKDLMGGGAIFNDSGSNTDISNSIFKENTSNYYGGAIYINPDSNTRIENSIFTKNSADSSGGAINAYNALSTIIINCTFFHNTSSQYGGAISSLSSDYNSSPGENSSNLYVYNSILWGDIPDEVPGSGTPSITYSNIQGGFSGEGNIDADPLLSPDGTYAPILFSPCVDTGDPGTATDTDIYGRARPFGSGYDMGAVEYYPGESDGDSDGMQDTWEITHFGNKDRDGTLDYDDDGLSDLKEYLAGTDPKLKDTDGDGMPDSWEVQHNLNPLLNDADEDGDTDSYTNYEEYLFGSDPNLKNLTKDERSALISLYNSTNGDNWTINTGWKDGLLHEDGFAMPGTEGNWHGVIIGYSSRSLIMYEIKLSDNNLNGTIPADIGNLSGLAALYLDDNHLSGTIPPEIGNKEYLFGLNLNGNLLTGEIPPALSNFTHLDPLDMQYNALYAIDDALISLLNSSCADWEKTQTLAPVQVNVESVTETSAVIQWEPVSYTADEGGYKVSFSKTQGGPYTFFGLTENKLDTRMTVTGLESDTTYYFVVQTQTNPHANNQNIVVSEYSLDASATTLLNKGDMDGNNELTLKDAIMALKALSGYPLILENRKMEDADVNGDRKIGMQEVLYIMQHLSGLKD